MTGGPPLHLDLGPVAALVGTWRGTGEGDYPTTESFRYTEETTFAHDGRPFLLYEQRTWRGAPPVPSHAERGFWRGYADGRVEAVIAQTGGIAEVAEGHATDGRVALASTVITRTSSAKEVRALWRMLEVAGDELTYAVDMAAMGEDRHFHLRATLRRVG